MVELYNEDGSLIGYVERDYAHFFWLENPASWFKETTDLILTKEEIDVVRCMLDDLDKCFGLRSNEQKLKEKIEKLTIK